MAKLDNDIFGSKVFYPFEAESITETIEFYTNINNSYDGSEERIQLRQRPRRYFEYVTPLNSLKKNEGFNAISGAIRKDWIIPIWTEAQAVGGVSSGDIAITCNTTYRNFNRYAILLNSFDDYEAFEISEVNDESISFTSGVTSDMTNPYLIPIEEAFISGSVSINTNGVYSKATLNFQIVLATDVDGDDPEQYNGFDIYTEPFLHEDGADRSIYQEQTITDFDIGPVAATSNWSASKLETPYYRIFDGIGEVQKFKEWFYRSAGRCGAFYMPTFESDLRVYSLGEDLTDEILIYSDSYSSHYENNKHIAIKDTSGNWYFREVMSLNSAAGGSLSSITLDSEIDLNDRAISFISYLHLARFNSDNVEIDWIGNGKAEVDVQIRSLFSE